MPRTTIIYAPHPDDEFLYLGSYVTHRAKAGDNLILVAATDGQSSGERPEGWRIEDLAAIRIAEQTAAWHWLSAGRGTISRVGSVDSKDPNLAAKITARANFYESQYGPDVEHYAACNNGQSQGVDHDAVALGLRAADVRVARFSNRFSGNGMKYMPVDVTAVEKADSAYSAFGHRSVASYFADLRASGYLNRVVS